MDKLDFKRVSIIFLIAIIARLIFHFVVYEPFADQFNWAHYPGQFNWYSDDNYDEIARSLISGKGFTKYGTYPNISRTPVYPLILAVQFYLVGDGYYVNLIINIAYQSLVCIILYYLTLKMFQERKLAILSSLIWALYPLPMLQTMGPHTEAIYEVFLISFVYFLYQFYMLENGKYLIYSSILMVIVTLTRPISILYPAYFMIVTVFCGRGAFPKRLTHFAVMSLIFAIGIAPWMLRGYKITGDIIPLVSYKSITYYQDKADKNTSDQTNKRNGFIGFAGKFKKEIQNPFLFLKSSLKRLIRFWYYGHSDPVRIVNAALQFPLLGLSILGIWLARKKQILIFPILSTVCYFWMAYAATHAISRYSFPMIALLCPFVAFGLAELLVTFKKRLMRKESALGSLSGWGT